MNVRQDGTIMTVTLEPSLSDSQYVKLFRNDEITDFSWFVHHRIYIPKCRSAVRLMIGFGHGDEVLTVNTTMLVWANLSTFNTFTGICFCVFSHDPLLFLWVSPKKYWDLSMSLCTSGRSLYLTELNCFRAYLHCNGSYNAGNSWYPEWIESLLVYSTSKVIHVCTLDQSLAVLWLWVVHRLWKWRLSGGSVYRFTCKIHTVSWEEVGDLLRSKTVQKMPGQ